jgi:hypothetical protein
MVYFPFRQYCKITDETHRTETILPVDSRGGGAFQRLKGVLRTAPILDYLQPGQRFFVVKDAVNVGIGGVLSQVQNGQERIIASYSKTFKKAERNYCVTRRELFAIVRTLEDFHKCLYGQEFDLRTDHCALTWHLSFKNLEGQTARWIQSLQEYIFISEHRQARKLYNSDGHSQRPCQEEFTRCHKFAARAEMKHVRDIAALAEAG